MNGFLHLGMRPPDVADAGDLVLVTLMMMSDERYSSYSELQTYRCQYGWEATIKNLERRS